MRRVAIVGAGMIPFGELFDRGIKDMVPDAMQAALDSIEKGMRRDEIEAAWFGELQSTDGFASGILADSCGLLNIPVSHIENACATGNDALRNAVHAVGGGYYDIALVLGADKTRESSVRSTLWEWIAMTRDKAWDYPLGLIAPANFALHVARYLHETPATREHMARIAVKNHRNAVTNPVAHLRFEVTVEQVLDAPIVVEPFGMLDCTPQSDGAAALVIAAETVVDRYTNRPVWVRGLGLGMDRVMHAQKTDLASFAAAEKAARQAYRSAGVKPGEIDVAELHDCFTGVEMMSYEALGFCARGEAYKLVESGATELGGRLPVNPSGGLKAKGHPPGATGVAQCVELFEQLRGEAANQVDAPATALAQNIGGPTAVSAVTILSNDRG